MRLFDAHLHIIDPRFPLVPNQAYIPKPFTCDDYREKMRGYNLVGGAVVSGSFQAFDTSYLADALEQLGPNFVGVIQLPESVTDEELVRLSDRGVRGVRFNLRRGGPESLVNLDRMARRIHEVVGWHAELYADAADLGELYDILVALPAVSIDHLGLSKEGLHTVTALAGEGVRVKATGFGRVDFDVLKALRQIFAANPASLMFGTDLPSTRAERLFSGADIDLVLDAVDEENAGRVFCGNAMEFYRDG